MFKQISKLFKSSTVVAVLLLSGCGGGRASSADGGSITVNPSTVAYTAPISKAAAPACSGSGFVYTAFVITVLNANGIPVTDAPLNVTLDNSTATTAGGIAATMTLYDDSTWLGSSSTPPTNAVGGSYSTSTGSNGTKRLIVGVDMSCESAGTLYVSSGALAGQTDLTVTAGLP